MKRIFKIFIDFDGTITTKDVGEAIFEKFGEPGSVKKIIDDLLSDRISAKESWLQLCDSVKQVSPDALNNFIDTLEIDPTFHRFYDFCEQNNFEYYILSDGFDYYIERILSNDGIEHIKYYANHLIITEDNKLVPSFPYQDEELQSSANCKRNHIINHSADDEFTIYIGDGNSDKETAQFCDFIFAKDDLLKFCERERISYFPYKDFNDVRLRIEKLMTKQNLKKRHQADLKRQEVYKQG
ncbi:MAG TPA: 2-hydroxy-3-keto-5-methylthiopentenyl-1-phosphate phosphatase [Ignavibacteria bacterium]|nr:2-hydroxy-3-keto-5-methylthiopentenyl-1-phosphate phosphatase [Ignavibacteria bacterium]